MAKKKKDSNLLCHLTYTRIGRDATKKAMEREKQVWDSVKKREKQLDTIIKLLKKIAK